ncbi:MAG: Gfo/Idh/MocA family oxidoreductase [Clostridia bacterium]|nr:Gfo/Idh/MocA family oxidoreductase [Clostridia bacterium]
MRVGVIGAGAISEIYLTNMINRFDNLEVVAVAARHIERAQRRAEQFALRACTVDEMMADPSIEMVVVLTPVGTHYSLIRQALLAGKHVYTEKTITDDLAGALELARLADERGLYLGCAPDTFLGAALQTARAAIDDGLLGDVHSFAISANRNNDVLLSLFAFLREPGAGVLRDYGVYYLTALTSLLGPVARVAGVIGTPYKTHVNILPGPDYGKVMDTPNESQVSAILKMRNGVTGTLHIDTDSKMQDEAYFTIYGTKGILYLTDPNQFGGEVSFHPNIGTDWRKPAAPVRLWNFASYADNSRGVGPSEMAAAIEEGRPCRASKEMAVHVLEVLDAILAGGEEGQFVDVKSVFERPAPLCRRDAGIVNIGHIAFEMKNEAEMLRFYGETLGMKPLFTLTVQDLANTYAARGQTDRIEELAPELEKDPAAPWIRYMKVSDRQFVELFFDRGRVREELLDRENVYGYRKYNLEVENIEALRDRVVSAGIKLREDVHLTIDGAVEFAVLDPDGNEVQFTQYGERSKLPLKAVHPCVPVSTAKGVTQIALQIQDAANMRGFYLRGLGLNKVFTLTYGDLADGLEAGGSADAEVINGLRQKAAQPWIDYIEMAPHQYIELFYTDGQEKREERDLSKYYGYQHICLEVSDIHAAWDAVTFNGIVPEREIILGSDGAYQFWLRDPDGNRIEIMSYSDRALQLS